MRLATIVAGSRLGVEIIGSGGCATVGSVVFFCVTAIFEKSSSLEINTLSLSLSLSWLLRAVGLMGGVP